MMMMMGPGDRLLVLVCAMTAWCVDCVVWSETVRVSMGVVVVVSQA